MSEKRQDRMGDMLTSLITMVGGINSQLQDVKTEIQDVKNEQKEIKSVIRSEVSKIKDKLTEMHIDQNHIWEKVVKNERELAILKGKQQI